MVDRAPAAEMRAAGLVLHDAINPAAVARVIDGTFVAICRAHDEPAIICENCWHFEVGDEQIAALVVALLNARNPLRTWLEITATLHELEFPQPCSVAASAYGLKTARAISGRADG